MHDDNDDERTPGTAILEMAFTINERCKLLEKLGARFTRTRRSVRA
jgi:hypothetical protein